MLKSLPIKTEVTNNMTTQETKTPAERYRRYQPIDQAENIANKQRILEIMQQMLDTTPVDLDNAIRANYHDDASINISHPINELSSAQDVGERFWLPLRQALPDVERRTDILAGGLYQDAHLVGCLGHYVGTLQNDWLGIPATGGVVAVRYAEGHVLREGNIAASYIFVDFLDLMRQVGYWPIAPSLGREMQWLSPMTHDGVILTPQDNAISERTLIRIFSMFNGLGIYKGQPLTNEMMDIIEAEDARHFHPNFLWYGSAGIGTTRGVKGFDDYHGHPFVNAFPDRGKP